jgi:type IX secretion system PorP/SprF family membrane protein
MSLHKWVLFMGVVCLFGLMPKKAAAQHFQFSQFFSSPLTLNPALTGRFSEDFRIAAIHRNQWSGIGSTFETTNLGCDINFKGGRLERDVVGAGVYFNKDNMGQNLLINQAIMLSGAYHRYIDRQRRHLLSGGVQAGFQQLSIDFSRLTFESQYYDFIYNPEIASGENFGSDRAHTYHINTGFSWAFRATPNITVHSGVAVADLFSTKESFFEGGMLWRSSHRFVWSGGMSWQINDKISLHPDVLFMNQAGGRLLNVGTALGYNVGGKNGITLFTGPWFRYGDAVIVMAGGKYRSFKLMGSYDHTASGLRIVKQAAEFNGKAALGAFEVSLIYTGKIKRAVPDAFSVPCGIF